MRGNKQWHIVRVVFLVALIPLLLGHYGCEGVRSVVADLEQDTQQGVNELQKNLVFFRHKTSGLCFATMTDLGLHHTRGYLAHVPCAGIPPHLLKEPTP